MASTYEVIEANAREHGPLCTLNTRQAAVLLGMTVDALEKTRSTKRLLPDGTSTIPFEPAGQRKVVYLLPVLLIILSKRPNGIPRHLHTLAILMGEDFCREVGVPYPKLADTQLAGNQKSGATQAVMSAPMGLAAMLGMGLSAPGDMKEPRKRGPKSMKADNAEARRVQRLGATVHRHRCEFVSMQDWLAGAEPDDAWLFVVPETGRPIDFTTSVICGGPGDDPLEWLTLSDYLARIARAAEEDRAKREQAALEADEK